MIDKLYEQACSYRAIVFGGLGLDGSYRRTDNLPVGESPTGAIA